MADGSVTPFIAGACFLLAALACARGWRAGAWLGAAGTAILAGALAARGLRAGRWPLTDHYEFALAFALATALAALLPAGKRGEKRDQPDNSPAIGASASRAAAMAMAAALVAYARLALPAARRVVQPLPPALDSIWLPLHVGAAALAYGALAVAGGAGFVYLLGGLDRSEAMHTWDRAIVLGYPLLTLSMILGMLWAQAAWGRYWAWDIKEVWTLITWLVYTLYWHLHHRQRWQGRRLAWLAVAGLAAILFTFLGVGWLARAVGLESLHL